MKKLLSVFWTLLLISGCSSYNPANSGMQKKMVSGGGFLFTTYQKITDSNKPYVFYIEGDGMAFRRGLPTANPTPRNPVALKLAAIDDRPNVVYIARPCQYTPMDENPKCDVKYWTTHRMSDDSIVAINEAINKINNGSKFSILGFSGGGAVASLIAARNKNVKDIVTIAGNLDHIEFSKYHKVNPVFMKPSLNPIDYTKALKHIPQYHLSGAADTRVPAFIAKKFTDKTKTESAHIYCASHIILPSVSHGNGWEQAFLSKAYLKHPKCKSSN